MTLNIKRPVLVDVSRAWLPEIDNLEAHLLGIEGGRLTMPLTHKGSQLVVGHGV
jgi:hypothetical protein